MSLEDTNFKVAFLVDARRRVTPTEKPIDVDIFSRGVRLCVLKLLSYFAHVRNDTQQAIGHLRWGLKVFHSYDYPPCKRDYLKQLSLKNFQDFEVQFAGDLEALSSSIRGKRAPKTPQVLTATSLRQALDDVIHDFQWDGPDVCSPVKRSTSPSPRKRTRSTHVQSADRAPLQSSKLLSKCIFLLMSCPVSRTELEEFCDLGPDDPLPSTSEFLDMVLPSSNSHKTFQDHNIALFWIDTSPWIVSGKRDNDGLSLVSAAMQELGGCVIPVHALVNQAQHITTSLQSIASAPDGSPSTSTEISASEPTHQDKDTSSMAPSSNTKSLPNSSPIKLTEMSKALKEKWETKDERSCAFLPFSSVMNHYMSKQTVSSRRGNETHLRLCLVKDGQVTDFCHLEVCPLTRNIPLEASPPKTTRTSPSKASSTHLSVTTPGWSQTFHVTNSKLSDPSDVEVIGSPSSRTRHKATSERRATIRAKLPVGAVPISQYQASAVYTCSGLALDSPTLLGKSYTVGEVRGRSSKIKHSSWFKEAMVSLGRQRKVLLVDMPHPVTSIPATAVLEPLTPTTASLRILKSWPIPGQVSTSHHDLAVPNKDEEGLKRRASQMMSGVEDVATKITRIAKEAAKGHGSMKELLRCPKGASGKSLPLPPSDSPCDMVSFQPHLLEPWFSYCPSGGASTRLIDHLQGIPHYDKLSEPGSPISVNQLLQQLEEAYSRHPGTVSSQSLAMKITEQTGTKTETQAKPEVDLGQVRQSPRLKKRKSTINIGFRTERIMQNSMRIQTTKEPSPQKKNERENGVPGIARSKTSTFECPNFDSEQDVIDCIQATYEKAVSESSRAMDFVQFTTSIVLSYMKSSSSESTDNDPVTKARALLTKNLLVSSNQLRDKYQSLSDEASKLLRVQEIELQVLLRLEMEAVSPTEVTPGEKKIPGEEDGVDEGEWRQEGGGESSGDEGTELPKNVQVLVDEIVKLLRHVPFLADPNRLTTFLAETFLQNYADSLPHILRAIYDDLMQPIPSILLSPSSDVTLSSVRTQPPPSYRSSSHGSFAEPSIAGIRTRSLSRHPSLADMGSKRMIPVPSRNIAKKKEKSKPKEVKDDGNSSAKTVRRNLFMGGVKRSPRKGGSRLQRRQSVAVMQNSHTRKSPRRHTPKKSKAPLVLKTRVVKETPGKQQVLQAMLKKQERARKIYATSGETVVLPTPTRVIEESPLKPSQAVYVRRSPRIKPRRPGDRRSFYSSSSSSDLMQARDLALRIAGKKTPPPNQMLKLTSRKSLLSEICSPGSLPSLQKSAPVEERLKSPSRNTRSQTRQTPSKELPGKVDEAEITSDQRIKEETVFKTPTRAPRRINFKSPSKNITTPIVDTTGGAIKDSDQPTDAQVVVVVEKSSKLIKEDELKSPDRCASSPTLRYARMSGGKTLTGPIGLETGFMSPSSKISVTSQISPKQDDAVITPSRRSQRVLKSPISDPTEQVSGSDNHPVPVTENTETTRDKLEKSLGTQGNLINLQIARSRKRTLADRSPSPHSKTTVNTPSPQKSTKSITPSSLQKWQRKKKPRCNSPERSSSPMFQKVTPPSAKQKRKTTTPSSSTPPKFGRVTPFSEKRHRMSSVRRSTKKQKQGTVTPEGTKGKTKQYKLGKVCKANVNLLTLMTDVDTPSASKMQTRSRSRESTNSESTSKELQNVSEEQQTETFTFLDSHLDDSDDDIDFPKIISPVHPKAKATISDEGSTTRVGIRAISRSPEFSARSLPSVFLSEDESSVSTDDVFLQASPSSSKRLRVTTPLTTGGLFELMNSPMVASGPKTESSRSKVSFTQPTRKGRQLYATGSQSSSESFSHNMGKGRQLYATGSQSSSESFSHNMGRRSSSLGLRRLSSGSPSGVR